MALDEEKAALHEYLTKMAEPAGDTSIKYDKARGVLQEYRSLSDRVRSMLMYGVSIIPGSWDDDEKAHGLLWCDKALQAGMKWDELEQTHAHLYGMLYVTEEHTKFLREQVHTPKLPKAKGKREVNGEKVGVASPGRQAQLADKVARAAREDADDDERLARRQAQRAVESAKAALVGVR